MTTAALHELDVASGRNEIEPRAEGNAGERERFTASLKENHKAKTGKARSFRSAIDVQAWLEREGNDDGAARGMERVEMILSAIEPGTSPPDLSFEEWTFDPPAIAEGSQGDPERPPLPEADPTGKEASEKTFPKTLLKETNMADSDQAATVPFPSDAARQHPKGLPANGRAAEWTFAKPLQDVRSAVHELMQYPTDLRAKFADELAELAAQLSAKQEAEPGETNEPDPTPEEIEQQCLQFQEGWKPGEHEKRAGKEPRAAWTAPNITHRPERRNQGD